jgi:hypothetical protein
LDSTLHLYQNPFYIDTTQTLDFICIDLSTKMTLTLFWGYATAPTGNDP